MRHAAFTVVIAALSATGPARAETVRVEFAGFVEFNGFASGPLAPVETNDPVLFAFEVDSDVFTDSASFPTRGYPIAIPTHEFTLGAVSVDLQTPFPAGQTPYFVIRDNDPGVDGFFVATSVDFPVGVPLDVDGVLGPLSHDCSVTYGPTLLPSLDVLDALGTYDFTGLQVFGWSLDDGPNKPVLILFQTLTISIATPCDADLDGSGAVDVTDLVRVILQWGCTGACAGDVNGDLVVDVQDLVAVILGWGPCP